MMHIGKVILKGIFNLIDDKTWREKKAVPFFLYCTYAVKLVFYLKLLRKPLHFEAIPPYKLRFFHYSIFLSLFEDMFLNDEYFVRLPKNPSIIDLGSEIGMSVCYFKSIYPEAKINAFEPDPESFRLLTDNVKNNNMKKVSLHNLAVANMKGRTSFFIDPVVDGSLTMSLSSSRQKRKVTVQVGLLSEYIKGPVDLLKIDIEGAELAVINNLVSSKKLSYINHMIIEYHHHIDPRINILSQLLTQLEKAGYGYQLRAKCTVPFQKQTYQDLLIYAYKEN